MVELSLYRSMQSRNSINVCDVGVGEVGVGEVGVGELTLTSLR